MRKLSFVLFVLLLTACTAVCDTNQCVITFDNQFPTPTQETGCWITPSDGNVNVRLGPSLSYSIIGLMEFEAETEVTNYINGWYEIWWFPTSQYGYTKAEFYTTEGACSFQ